MVHRSQSKTPTKSQTGRDSKPSSTTKVKQTKSTPTKSTATPTKKTDTKRNAIPTKKTVTPVKKTAGKGASTKGKVKTVETPRAKGGTGRPPRKGKEVDKNDSGVSDVEVSLCKLR